MKPTRRFWALAMLGCLSAVLAILFTDVLWLGIPLGVGMYLLIEQFTFTARLSDVMQTQLLQQSLTRDTVIVGDTTTLTIQLPDDRTLINELNAQLTVEAHPALDFETVREYDLTQSNHPISIPLQVTVAGTYKIDAQAIQFTSHRGLFQETLHIGNQCSITGEPRVPRDIHIGTGGERIAVEHGEHEASQGGSGLSPGELREYLPGDPANRIDWKTTARFGDPFVREFDPETTRQTHLVVDRRNQMLAGPSGQTKLDYAREVAIWLTEYVTRLNDPLGVTLIKEDVITGPTTPNTGTMQYQRIRRELLDLIIEESAESKAASRHPHLTPSTPRSGRDAQRHVAALNGDDAFAETLRSYFQTVEAYTEQVAENPLFQSVHARLADHSGDSWVVIITDDTNRAGVLEIARAAATQNTFITFFLLPSVLFERSGFTDLDAAYQDYTDFEAFRQQVSRTANVTAFEVGPRDRLESLFNTARTRGTQQ